jgi:hypothetical protein
MRRQTALDSLRQRQHAKGFPEEGCFIRTNHQRVRFSIGHNDRTSRYVEAKLVSLKGKRIEIETSLIEVDGFHIAYNNSPVWRNRVHLIWKKHSVGLTRGVAETMWYQRMSYLNSKYLVALRLIEVSKPGTPDTTARRSDL